MKTGLQKVTHDPNGADRRNEEEARGHLLKGNTILGGGCGFGG